MHKFIRQIVARQNQSKYTYREQSTGINFNVLIPLTLLIKQLYFYLSLHTSEAVRDMEGKKKKLSFPERMCKQRKTFNRKNWDTAPFTLWLSSGVGSCGAGKQSMRCVLFSVECPGAKEWACCHPGGFECFITVYTKDQLPTARSLTSGQQWRQSRREAFHCPATTPASTFTEPAWPGMKDDL